jgi:uncharacterized protein (TIGR02246 family)
MRVHHLLIVVMLLAFNGCRFVANAQKPSAANAEDEAINALYREWSQAIVTRGAEGYASYFVPDGAVLPPNEPAAEGRQAIREWIQKSLDKTTVKDPRLSFGELRVKDGWATRRFTMTGERVTKEGGAAVKFNNKYLDVLQKQADGTWRFVYRIYNSNE